MISSKNMCISQQLPNKSIVQSRNHDDYTDCEINEKNRKCENSSQNRNFLPEELHPDFLPLMKKFMDFLIQQPEYHRLVLQSNRKDCNFGEAQFNSEVDSENINIKPKIPNSSSSMNKNCQASENSINYSVKDSASNSSFKSILQTERTDKNHERSVSFSKQTDDNPKQKRLSRFESSDISDERDKIGLNNLLSEISNSYSGINAAVMDISRRLCNLEKKREFSENSTTIIEKQRILSDIEDDFRFYTRKKPKHKSKIPIIVQSVNDKKNPPKTDSKNENSGPKSANNKTRNNINPDKKKQTEIKEIESNNKYPKTKEIESLIADEDLSDDKLPIAETDPEKYPTNGKYLVDGLASLSAEISKNFNLLISYSLLFPEQFDLPIFIENCENLNLLNINLNRINSNILLFLTEISCNTPSRNDNLFRIRHLINTISRKSFVDKLNKLIVDLIKFIIKIITIFQNIRIFEFEFKLFRQFNSYLFLFKDIIKHGAFEKFYDEKFLEIVDNLTRDFLYINFKIKNILNKSKKRNLNTNDKSRIESIKEDENTNKTNKIIENSTNDELKKDLNNFDKISSNDFNDFVKYFTCHHYNVISEKIINHFNNITLSNISNVYQNKDFLINFEKFFNIDLKYTIIKFYSNNVYKKINDIFYKSFENFPNDHSIRTTLEKFHIEFLKKFYLQVCDGILNIILGKNNYLSELNFNNVFVFSVFSKFFAYIPHFVSSSLLFDAISVFNCLFPSLNSASSFFDSLNSLFSISLAPSFQLSLFSTLFSSVFSIFHSNSSKELVSSLPLFSFYHNFFLFFSNRSMNFIEKEITRILKLVENKPNTFIPIKHISKIINSHISKIIYGKIFLNIFVKFEISHESFQPTSSINIRNKTLSNILNCLLDDSSNFDNNITSYTTNLLREDLSLKSFDKQIMDSIFDYISNGLLLKCLLDSIGENLKTHCSSFITRVVGQPTVVPDTQPTQKDTSKLHSLNSYPQKSQTFTTNYNNTTINNFNINLPSSLSIDQIDNLLTAFRELSQHTCSSPSSQTLLNVNSQSISENGSQMSYHNHPINENLPSVQVSNIMPYKNNMTLKSNTPPFSQSEDLFSQFTLEESNSPSNHFTKLSSDENLSLLDEQENGCSSDFEQVIITSPQKNSNVQIIIEDSPPTSPIHTTTSPEITALTGVVEMFDIWTGSGTIRRIDNKPVFFNISGIIPQSLFFITDGASVIFDQYEKRDKLNNIVTYARNIKYIHDEFAPPKTVSFITKLDILSKKRYINKVLGDAMYDSSVLNNNDPKFTYNYLYSLILSYINEFDIPPEHESNLNEFIQNITDKAEVKIGRRKERSITESTIIDENLDLESFFKDPKTPSSNKSNLKNNIYSSKITPASQLTKNNRKVIEEKYNFRSKKIQKKD